MQRIAFGVLGIGLCAGIVQAQQDVVEIYGFEFALIGDPGNRDTNEFEVPLFPDTRVGGVEYEYRLATTEVTVEQYFEFVEAYYPFYVKRTGNEIGFGNFTGSGIRAAFGEVHILPSVSPDQPADMSWEYAARYLNWLHHGKVVESWAFEAGVYDTSTFVQDDAGNWQHQESHSQGARFWMPTRDEWMKAAYWDPEKDNGEGGYWRYQNRSDIEPIPSLLPEDGGERNAGDIDVFPIDVLSYTDVYSPWGLFDMAGGQPEFLESISGGNPFRRVAAGSGYWEQRYGDIFSNDIIAYARTLNADLDNFGIRIASTTEAPADLDQNGVVNFFDVAIFINWFIDHNERADFHLDGVFDADDVRVFLGFVAAQ